MTNEQREIVEKYVKALNENLDKHMSNKEGLHSIADDILVEALKELGFNEIADAYMKCSDAGFWYC